MQQVSKALRPVMSARSVTPITPKVLPQKNPDTVKIMHCDVVFGSPSADCRGTGICKITGTNGVRRQLILKKDCHLTFGQISAAPGDKVSLFFFREFLCIHLYRLHFRKGVFCMKESCPLPKAITAGLGIQSKQLLSGNYAVVECDGYFRVDVDCA